MTSSEEFDPELVVDGVNLGKNVQEYKEATKRLATKGFSEELYEDLVFPEKESFEAVDEFIESPQFQKLDPVSQDLYKYELLLKSYKEEEYHERTDKNGNEHRVYKVSRDGQDYFMSMP